MTTTNTTTPEAAAYTTADELRDLLADTPHPDDLDEALACLPLDLEAFHARMAAAVASRAAASPAEAVGVVHEAIQACALPGHVIGAEFAALIDRLVRGRRSGPGARRRLLRTPGEPALSGRTLHSQAA